MTRSAPLTPRPSDMPELKLEQAGFSTDEIKQLRDIKDMYPYIEYVGSRHEMKRLRFVRWLYNKGEIER